MASNENPTIADWTRVAMLLLPLIALALYFTANPTSWSALGEVQEREQRTPMVTDPESIKAGSIVLSRDRAAEA